MTVCRRPSDAGARRTLRLEVMRRVQSECAGKCVCVCVCVCVLVCVGVRARSYITEAKPWDGTT